MALVTERSRERDAAIIGMACIFPGAPDLETYAENLRRGVDAIRPVPPERWEPLFYDPASSAPDRFYCRRGGFIDEHARFDALGFGVMPVAAQGAEPDQLLALQVAQAALADAGYGAGGRALPRERTGVVIGRGNYIGAGMTRLEQHVRTGEQLIACLRTLVPSLSEEELVRVKREFQGQLGAYGPDTAIGLVPNLTASRIANRMDLMGPAFTLDAACASSLVALDEACRSLAEERTDLMLCGGVHLSHDVAFWSVFCQLGALSRSEQIRPFDARADGLLIGEGLGLVVLKRLGDAERDGDPIYAVVRGTGVSSDGREASILAPRVDGQVLALSRAYAAARVAPETVGLVECHGTGTPAGDTAELTTLARFFGAAPEGGRRAVVGSVKSMIGHAMPAAGVAGLIKAALAVRGGVLLPTLHCDEPHPLLQQTRFRTTAVAEPWEQGGVSRRAAVSAFGFGGINAHVVLEAHDAAQTPTFAPGARALGLRAEEGAAERVLLLAAPTPEALLQLLERGSQELGEGPARLALFEPTPERRALAAEAVRRGVARHGREGIAFTPRGLAHDGGRLAFLFPGVEAAFAPRVEDVAARFGRPLPPCTQPRNLEEQGVGIIGVGRLLHEVLLELGLRPDALAGHSIGEWTGLIAAGMLDGEAVDDFVDTLAPGSLEVPGVVFAAAGCGAEVAAEALQGLDELTISHDNCPHQLILCGVEASVDEALERLRRRRVLGQKLPFRSGFHSRLFEPYLGAHREHLARLALGPPSVPLWSATTCAPYPAEPAQVRQLFIEHLVRPVRFRELTQALYQHGVRFFVQLGVGSLPGFVDDTLRERPHLALSASVSQRSGLSQLRRLCASLWVEGLPVELARLGIAPRSRARSPLSLQLGVPLVRLSTPLSQAALVPAAVEGGRAQGGAVGQALRSSLEALTRAQGEVAAAFEVAAARGPAPRTPAAPPSRQGAASAVASAGSTAPFATPPAPVAPVAREVTTTVTLSTEVAPHLLDHCFFRQPEGWASVADRYPVVPMTMTIARLIEAARALMPGRAVVAVEKVRAFRWLAVEPAATVTFQARVEGPDRVAVAAAGFTEAVVVFGAARPAPPEPTFAPLQEARPPAVDAEALYREHWMFHGPSYQAVRALGPTGRDGIAGELVNLPVEGALLDNVGQLFGYWIMENSDRDRLAMPVKVDRLAFFGDDPAAGEVLHCEVRVRSFAAREVRADMEVWRGGRVWAAITGWEDWRFESDGRLWPVVREPERHLYAEPREGGAYVLLGGAGRTPAARDYLARRFLCESERAELGAVAERGQRAWLLGRIAAKDAARERVWRSEPGVALFPTEVQVRTDEVGRPSLSGARAQGLRVSIAHKDDVAVAKVASRSVGIDVEPVVERTEAFGAAAFTEAERALVAALPRDEWWTRLWCAKEAVGKALGTGLGGAPGRLPVESVAGERVRCAGRWVETRRDGAYVVAYTVDEANDASDAAGAPEERA